MAFEKGHEKLGGRKKGTGNKGTESIKALLNTLLPEDELALHYMFGKPVQPVVGEELAPPINHTNCTPFHND